jgi:hypothetical protein
MPSGLTFIKLWSVITADTRNQVVKEQSPKRLNIMTEETIFVNRLANFFLLGWLFSERVNRLNDLDLFVNLFFPFTRSFIYKKGRF